MGRAPCCQKTGLKRGPWTPEEDQKLIDYINTNGCGNWRNLPKNAGLERCGKSCRLRWTNYLRPDIKRGRFSFEEEETIIQLHSILGNKWSAIAARLPGRTDNEIKNYWNTHIRKRLLKMGIDPVTHSPRLDLLDLSSILNSQSQMNFSRLLGMQNLINPELLRLATSLFSTQQVQNQDFLMQNLSTISNNNTQFLEQISTPSLLQNLTVPTCFDTTSTVPIGQAHDHHQVVQYEDIQQCPRINLSEFSHIDNWNQTNDGATFSGLPEDYVPVTNYSNTSDFNFQSFLSNISSTPNSSSSTPMNSSSTNYINSSSTTSTTTEDERGSYCSSMMKFEILDHILDVNDFIE